MKFKMKIENPGLIEKEIWEHFLNNNDILRISKTSNDLKFDILSNQVSNLKECIVMLARKMDESQFPQD